VREHVMNKSIYRNVIMMEVIAVDQMLNVFQSFQIREIQIVNAKRRGRILRTLIQKIQITFFQMLGLIATLVIVVMLMTLQLNS
jgi:hypothetical protein